LEEDKAGVFISDKINALLPPNVRVLGAIPISKTWSARTATRGRIYEYLLPEDRLAGISSQSGLNSLETERRFRSLLDKYFGTHCWHNYTIGSTVAKAYKSKGMHRPWLNYKETPSKDLAETSSTDDAEDDVGVEGDVDDEESQGQTQTKMAVPWVRQNIRRCDQLFRTVHAINLDKILVQNQPYVRLLSLRFSDL